MKSQICKREAFWHFTYFKVLQIYTDFRTFAADFEYSLKSATTRLI